MVMTGYKENIVHWLLSTSALAGKAVTAKVALAGGSEGKNSAYIALTTGKSTIHNIIIIIKISTRYSL
jgi:hypothetical protein